MRRLWPGILVLAGCVPGNTVAPSPGHQVVVAPAGDLRSLVGSIRARGGRHVQVLPAIGAVTYTGEPVATDDLPAGTLTWVDRPRPMLPRMRAASPLDLTAPRIPWHGPEGESLGGYQWNLTTGRIRDAWTLVPTRGAGVTVAVLDTGIDPDNPDLIGQIDLAGARSFVGAPGDWLDRNGHGTHVSGIVGARLDGRGVVGVAPGCKIVPVKVLGDDGWGTDAAVLEGLDWAARTGAGIVNLSLSGLHDRDGQAFTLRAAYARAIARLHDRGIVVVMASGNEGVTVTPDGPLVLPAQAGEGLVVGATGPVEGHHPERFAPYTNQGRDLLDLAAPGGGIRIAADGTWQVNPSDLVLSTWSTHALSRSERGVAFEAAEHRYLAGTSMACAHVSGVAALLRAARPDLEARWLERAILAGARPRGPRDRYGNGVLDAVRSHACATGEGPGRSGDPRPSAIP